LKTHTILEARTKVKYIGLQNSIVFREVRRLYNTIAFKIPQKIKKEKELSMES